MKPAYRGHVINSEYASVREYKGQKPLPKQYHSTLRFSFFQVRVL